MFAPVYSYRFRINVVFCGRFLLGVWAATQWGPTSFGLILFFGANRGLLGDTPVYYPWRLFRVVVCVRALCAEVFVRGRLDCHWILVPGRGLCHYRVCLARTAGHDGWTTSGLPVGPPASGHEACRSFWETAFSLAGLMSLFFATMVPNMVMTFATDTSGKRGACRTTLLAWPAFTTVVHDIKGGELGASHRRRRLSLTGQAV